MFDSENYAGVPKGESAIHHSALHSPPFASRFYVICRCVKIKRNKTELKTAKFSLSLSVSPAFAWPQNDQIKENKRQTTINCISFFFSICLGCAAFIVCLFFYFSFLVLRSVYVCLSVHQFVLSAVHPIAHYYLLIFNFIALILILIHFTTPHRTLPHITIESTKHPERVALNFLRFFFNFFMLFCIAQFFFSSVSSVGGIFILS